MSSKSFIISEFTVISFCIENLLININKLEENLNISNEEKYINNVLKFLLLNKNFNLCALFFK